jgi:hypothetical protein
MDPDSTIFKEIAEHLRGSANVPGSQIRRADDTDYRKNVLARLRNDWPSPDRYRLPPVPLEYEVCYNVVGKDGAPMCPEDWRDPASACPAEFRKAECRDDPQCSDLLFRGRCSVTCYTCFWLVRSFPVFEEGCSGFAKGESEKSLKAQASTSWQLAREKNLRSAEAPGLGSPKLGKEKSPTLQSSGKDCMAMWEEFLHSPKARYLLQYVDALGGRPWNAHTVCKCMGKCAYNSYEALDLSTQCVYEDNADRAAILFPDLPASMADEMGTLSSGRQYDPDRLRRTPLWPGGELQRAVVGDGTSKAPNGSLRGRGGADKDDVYTAWDNTGVVLGKGKPDRTDVAGEPGLHEVWNPIGGVAPWVGNKKPGLSRGVNVPSGPR